MDRSWETDLIQNSTCRLDLGRCVWPTERVSLSPMKSSKKMGGRTALLRWLADWHLSLVIPAQIHIREDDESEASVLRVEHEDRPYRGGERGCCGGEVKIVVADLFEQSWRSSCRTQQWDRARIQERSRVWSLLQGVQEAIGGQATVAQGRYGGGSCEAGRLNDWRVFFQRRILTRKEVPLLLLNLLQSAVFLVRRHSLSSSWRSWDSLRTRRSLSKWIRSLTISERMLCIVSQASTSISLRR